MRMIKYNGISLGVSSKKSVFTHSVSAKVITSGKLESDKNIPYFERLMQYKETDIPEGELLHEVCALYSIRNLNYQVCNGGFRQYYDNGYHKFKAGFEIGDLANLDIFEQIKFLDKFILFILFDERKKKYSSDLTRAVVLFREMPNNIEEYECLDSGDGHAEIEGADAFDEQWYKVNEIIEWGMELYAQYLIKRLEMMNIEPVNKQN